MNLNINFRFININKMIFNCKLCKPTDFKLQKRARDHFGKSNNISYFENDSQNNLK